MYFCEKNAECIWNCSCPYFVKKCGECFCSILALYILKSIEKNKLIIEVSNTTLDMLLDLREWYHMARYGEESHEIMVIDKNFQMI